MALSTRAQLFTLLNSNVLTGGNRTTAQMIRDFENAIIESLINHIDDVNTPGGYLGIDAINANVDISFIKATTPTASKFLRDDGTWQVASAGVPSLDVVLGIGSNTNDIPIVSATNISTLTVSDAVADLSFDDGFGSSLIRLNSSGVLIDTELNVNAVAGSYIFNGYNGDASFNLVSPSTYTAPILRFFNDFNILSGSISSTAGVLYLGGVGGYPLRLDGGNIFLPFQTADTLTYLDGSKRLVSVTLGSGLDFTAGVLSSTYTVPSLDVVLGVGSNTNGIPIFSQTGICELRVDDSYSYFRFNDGFTDSGYYLSTLGLELLSDVGIEINAPYTNITNAFYQTHTLLSGEQGRIYSDAGNVLTEVTTITGETMQFNLLGSVGAGMYVSNALGTLGSYITINVVNQAVSDGSNSKMIIDDQIDSKGLVYHADYSANFTDNSLVNKKFVKDEVHTPRVKTVTSSGTPTPNADTDDLFKITAQAAAATFAVPSGTPKSGQALLIRIKDNGTARALSFNSIYRFSIDQVAPTTTIVGKIIYLGFVYNSTDSKWDCLGWITNI